MIGIEAGSVTGKLNKEDFPTLFTSLSHAGASGIVFVGIWLLIAWTQISYMQSTFLFAVIFSFLVMMIYSSQVSNNISANKLTTKSPEVGFDWILYCRKHMSFIIFIFILNTCVLMFFSGGIQSPFIPFYIMVFTIALSNCKHLQPALLVTLSFVGIFLIAMIFSIIPFLANYSNVPHISNKLWLDFGFAVASMLVPYISGLIEWRRSPEKQAPKA
jgi:predicted tellurium resistance membrane protein TerC